MYKRMHVYQLVLREIITHSGSGVSRISYRGGGGGGLKYFGKVGVFAWREARGFGGMLPREIFFKMMQFGAFWRIFC